MVTQVAFTTLRTGAGRRLVAVALRVALAAAFASAVADRFGLWGRAGEPGVMWGNYAAFLDYTWLLLPVLPRALSDVLGGVATALEVVLSVWLLSGVQLARGAVAGAGLLALFALAMCCSVGPKSVLDYSVLTAFAARLSLAGYAQPLRGSVPVRGR